MRAEAFLRFCALALWLLCLPGGARAEEVVLSKQTREVDLNAHLSILHDPAGGLTPPQAEAHGAGFRPLPKSGINIGYTADAIWLRFALRSEAAHETTWVAELPSARLDSVEWYLFAPGQLRATQEGGALHPAAQQGRRYPTFQFPLGPGETLEVLVRIRSATSIVVPLRLYSPTAFREMEHTREWGKGLFLGYVGALAIFGLLLAGVARHRIFLLYALIITSFWVNALCMTGYWTWLGLPGARVMEREGLIINGVLGVVFLLLFHRYFFGLRQTLPRLDAVLQRVLLLYPALLLGIPFISFHTLKVVQGGFEVAVYLGTIALSLYFVVKGFRPARFFFFGWLGFWLLYTFLLLQVLGILPFRGISPTLVEVAFAVGGTFFLLAVAGWVRQIQQENDLARDRELALQREMLTRLEHEVAERTNDLREAKEHAEEANRSKGLFLANISHEIRTPLSTLVGLSQAMWMQAEKYALPGEFAQFLNQVRSGGQYLNLILTNLLDISAAEAGRTPLHWQEIRVGEWAGSIQDLLEPIAKNHGVRLVWQREFPPESTFESDLVRLTQIILNIAHNAIKLSEPGQQVEITLRKEAHTLELAVCDDGPGILEADMQAIFRAFTQSHATPRPGDQGVGLGLAVVQLNAGLLGGQVCAENKACGGARFTVTLPPREKGPDASRDDR